MAKPHLIALSYSPWSERARWALDHHQIVYRRSEHVPMLGEPLLRLRAKKLTGRVTVPVLIHDGAVFDDSCAIARHADEIGAGEPLFPTEHGAAIEEWNRTSDETLALARTLVTFKTGASQRAKEEALPPFIPRVVRPLASPMASLGVNFFIRKYHLDKSALARAERGIEETLVRLREALTDKSYLLGGFSFADIAMAAVLQAVKPVVGKHMQLGPGTRECWTMPELAERYSDLLAWRDKLYAERRPARAQA